MTRVRWITAEVPDLALGGGSIRQAHLLAAVAAAHETELVLVGRLRDERLRASLASVVELPVPDYPARPSSSLGRRVGDVRRSLLDGRAGEVVGEAPNVTVLDQALPGLDPVDVVQVEHSGLAPLVRHRRPGQRWWLTFQSLESARAVHRLAVAPGRRHRWLLRRERDKALRHEAWVRSTFDRVAVTSAEDAALLGGDSAVVPNGVDVAAFPVTPLPSTPRLAFTGTLDYLPNVEGIVWFCREVLPRVRDAVPAVTLAVAGRKPVAAVRALAHLPGVTVDADVPSVLPYLQSARVAVVPVRIGSGTRLKVLEAMAAGRPVVGSPEGVAGLGVVDGRDLVAAATAPDMAGAIVGLLEDDARAAALAAAGRRCAERFDWAGIGRRYAQLLGES